jgi:hypothetical protein
MSYLLSPIGNGQQFFTNIGLPLSGGQITTYQAGSTTPLSTYTDSTGTVANSNPIVLGTSGRSSNEIWLNSGYSYKFVVADSSSNVLFTLDNLYGIPTSTSSGTVVPSGSIILWSGSIGSVPSGYYLCNGQNGTPNLEDTFIIGAGNSYSVNATGTVFGSGSSAPNYYALCYIMKS